jgi:transcriptional regulator with XRE-family HTH domain
MSEAITSVTKDAYPSDLPLSVLLFHSAMRQDIPLSDYAKNIGIGALSLRQFISGQTQRPRGKTLELLANTLGMAVEEVRRRTAIRPTSAPPFCEWLKNKMDGRFSRARLTRETRISDGALRNYLSGQTLPDSDQAQRLAETLDVDPLELAKVLVADQTVRAGGETVLPPTAGTGLTATAGTTLMADGTLSLAGGDTNGEHPAGARGSQTTRAAIISGDEEHLINLWRQLHPQARRATLIYIAGLLTEE